MRNRRRGLGRLDVTTSTTAEPDNDAPPAARTGAAERSAAPVRRGRRRRRGSREPVVLTVAGVVCLFGAFELAPRLGILPRSSFPPTSAVLAELGRLFTTGAY